MPKYKATITIEFSDEMYSDVESLESAKECVEEMIGGEADWPDEQKVVVEEVKS